MKNVSFLRATYQIRLLAFKAVSQRKRLILKVPVTCQFALPLKHLAALTSGAIQREEL